MYNQNSFYNSKQYIKIYSSFWFELKFNYQICDSHDSQSIKEPNSPIQGLVVLKGLSIDKQTYLHPLSVHNSRLIGWFFLLLESTKIESVDSGNAFRTAHAGYGI